jgi:3-isopropylmalate dehydrogenase
MLLRHSAGMAQEATDMEAAIHEVLDDGYRTADLAQPGAVNIVSTTKMGELVEQAFVATMDRRFSYHAV